MYVISWLGDISKAPLGGTVLTAEYRNGRGEGALHLARLNPILSPLFGEALFPGSLNLWSDTPVTLPSPLAQLAAGELWWFSPVIIGAQAAGIAARRADSGDIEFIEVFAPNRLASQLSLTHGSKVGVRILEGYHLAAAA